MTMEELNSVVEEINVLMDEIKKNNEWNLKGNRTAGRRARKFSVELGKKLKDFRKFSIEANRKARTV